jgi:thymidylate synthase ThyX
MYKAQIVADSSCNNSRITSMLLTYPRIIHSEFMTHRMFARNAASSRAIPFKKMVKDVIENIFIPIAWQKHHSGMQGTEYITDKQEIDKRVIDWIIARDSAIDQAEGLYDKGITKQLCNRLLEPFQYITVLVTATEWENFFKLRCPEYVMETSYEDQVFRSKKDYIRNVGLPANPSDYDNWTDLDWLQINKSQAEIHIQHIAELMWDALNESTPKQLQPGEWHIPFGDKIDTDEILDISLIKEPMNIDLSDNSIDRLISDYAVKIATARCARLSYMTLGAEPKIDYEADIKLHDMLLESEHMSPFEHCAKAMSEEEFNGFVSGYTSGYYDFDDSEKGWCRNFRGFIPYRHLIETR